MSDKLTDLKGVGEKKAALLSKMNINTITDLLRFSPRAYEDRRNISDIRDIVDGNSYLVKGKVLTLIKGNRYTKGKTVLRVKIGDSTGEIFAVFFNANYISKLLPIGRECLFYGNVRDGKMIFPEFGNVEQGIVPVYPLTKGMTQGELRKIMKQALEYSGQLLETLPEYISERNNLCPLTYAINNLHFPEGSDKYKAAIYRIRFEELLAFQLGLNIMKKGNYKSRIGKQAKGKEEEYIANIPFELTEPQRKVIKEISRDLESSTAMNRLLQGDVGSGKTVVAEVAIYKTAKSKLQSALMAPTEVLARQHFESISKSFNKENINISILTGSTKKSEKSKILKDLQEGKIDLIIGTHAIIEEGVKFNNLGLVVTDEQHRFGVTQRALLTEKGQNEEHPNILVMTATPIPRTLGVILYGDLDISIIDQLPKERKPIITRKLSNKEKWKSYDLLKKEVGKGRQAYVVTPLIEDSEAIEASSAETVYKELSEELRGIKVALLHGNMKDTEKNEIMYKFKLGEIQVLVSTVVIEVGINVPNASLMIIESSHRFGLAQLHQLRGRVGRSNEQSYCILLYEKSTPISDQRLDIMVESTDGFYISEKDLELRGVGDIFGTAQSGFVLNKIFELAKDVKLLEKTQEAAEEILKNDPLLEKKENGLIRERLDEVFGNTISFLNKI